MVKVSVIIPFYNQNIEYLKQALVSVLNQTLKDIEITCIDDGSTDNTCYNYINQLTDNRIRLYKKEHEGAGSARNLGIEKALGENIMFLDSDDFYPENTVLERLYEIKKTNNVLVAGAKHLLLSNGKYEEPYFNYGNINNYFCNKVVKYRDYQFPWWYWCFMFDTPLIKGNNIKFPPYIRYQDPPFYVRVMNLAGEFYAADFISYIHRDSGKLFNMTVDMAKAHVTGIADLLNYSKENHLEKLYNLLYDLFFSFDLKFLEKVEGIQPEILQKMINKIEKINS